MNNTYNKQNLNIQQHDKITKKRHVLYTGHLQEIQYKQHVNFLDKNLQQTQNFLENLQNKLKYQTKDSINNNIMQQVYLSYSAVVQVMNFLFSIKSNIRQIVRIKEQQKNSYQNLIDHKEKQLKKLKKLLQNKKLQLMDYQLKENFFLQQKDKTSFETIDTLKNDPKTIESKAQKNLILKSIQIKFYQKLDEYRQLQNQNQNQDQKNEQIQQKLQNQAQYFSKMKLQNNKRISMLRKYLNSIIVKDNEKQNDITNQKENQFLVQKLKIIIGMNKKLNQHNLKNPLTPITTQLQQERKSNQQQTLDKLKNWLEDKKQNNKKIGYIFEENFQKFFRNSKILKNKNQQNIFLEIYFTLFKTIYNCINTNQRNFQHFEILQQKKISNQQYFEKLDEEEKKLRLQLQRLSDKNLNKVNPDLQEISELMKQRFNTFSIGHLYSEHLFES